MMHTICEYREEKCNAGQGTDWEIVDELPFLENGRGYVSKTRRSLMLFDADNGDIVQITPKWFETASFSLAIFIFETAIASLTRVNFRL